jgi:lipid-A-disaccharide synthase
LIDFPDFNLRLARVAKDAGIPVLYYISPQVWAWRSGRTKKIAQRVGKMAVIFPF